MPMMTRGGQSDGSPWFAPKTPWAFWGPPSIRKMMNNGADPQALMSRSEMQYGFAPYGVSRTIASTASGMVGANQPATVQNVLNLSAAAIGSGGAFSRHGRPDQ